MHALIIDTSTEKGLVAFASGKKILYQKSLQCGFQQSQHLLPTISEGFDALSLKPSQLAYVAVGVGPGSYTGIRVAATVAKTYAFSCQIPLVSFCSLEGFVPDREGTFAALIDAKMSGVYLLKGIRRGELITYMSEPQVLPLHLAEGFLKNLDFYVTPHSSSLQTKLPFLLGEWQESTLMAEQLAHLVYNKFCANDICDQGLDLLYLRQTQAEIERESRRKLTRSNLP